MEPLLGLQDGLFVCKDYVSIIPQHKNLWESKPSVVCEPLSPNHYQLGASTASLLLNLFATFIALIRFRSSYLVVCSASLRTYIYVDFMTYCRLWLCHLHITSTLLISPVCTGLQTSYPIYNGTKAFRILRPVPYS